jgi:hypothetical protein
MGLGLIGGRHAWALEHQTGGDEQRRGELESAHEPWFPLS